MSLYLVLYLDFLVADIIYWMEILHYKVRGWKLKVEPLENALAFGFTLWSYCELAEFLIQYCSLATGQSVGPIETDIMIVFRRSG